MKAAKKFTKNNFYQFICLLSGAASAFHYEKVLSIIGKYQCNWNVLNIRDNFLIKEKNLAIKIVLSKEW